MPINQNGKSNSKNGSGPKSEAGKKRSRFNALREGYFSKELNLKEDERPEFDALRAAVQSQLEPATLTVTLRGFALVGDEAGRLG